ncbi:MULTISPECIES: response regulator transcription factor [Rummeliibacillus]|jgi:DNA-binding response OmpR family regulator|uniref:response regulator transcription factor n=1 Tax=Rummeliibacillus TaxID=648802 RepID=UPI0011B6322F|nr:MULTISPECIES: response regulator transcription factor [Rummeliibacillus]MBO2535150.1 response regulator transcription factor [Rummeliibacillus suwonensis]
MTKILIVDDEQDMRNLIDVMLRQSGFQSLQANGGQEALKLLKEQHVDLVILDVMMPQMDGFTVCKEMRKVTAVPIIFLTAKDANEDKVKGLTMGADDYVVKPFSSSELVARIQAVLRRTEGEVIEEPQKMIVKGPIELDDVSRKVYVQGKVIPLTLKEFEILRLFMNNENVVYTRDQLLEIIWDLHYSGGTRTVDTHIKTLRLKLGDEAGKFIQTVWGLGYRFEVSK